MFMRCPFCHKLVLRWFYPRHKRKHTRRRRDGQMAEHVTAAPAQRFSGSLSEVPQTYVHTKCGVATQMPEEIIRSYLVNPMMCSDASFCCGCGRYVFSAELTWEETGETVIDYLGRLRTKYLQRTYGAQRLTEQRVFVTPRAAAAFHEAARSQGLSSPYFLSLEMPDATSEGNYKASLSPHRNPEVECVVASSGVQVTFRRDQAEALQRVVVDFPEGAETGFSIGRIGS